MKKNIKNIVLDFGGVVINLDRGEAVRRFEAIGVEGAESMLGQFWHNGIFSQLEEGKITKEQFYDGVRELVGQNIADEAMDYAWLGFIAGVPQRRLDYIKKLREKYNVYLLSNTNPIVMKWALSSAFSLEGEPLDSYFDKLYLSFRMKTLKPNRDIYELMLSDGGMIADETLFLDDSRANLCGAEAVGIHTMLTINGEDWMDELTFRLTE